MWCQNIGSMLFVLSQARMWQTNGYTDRWADKIVITKAALVIWIFCMDDNHDDDNSHQPCPVVVFQYTTTDTVYRVVSAITRT